MEEEKRIIAYKGFDENLKCRGFQYEVGKEYEHDGEVECCSSGFHACTNPFDVLDYYDENGRNRFCVVEQSGTIKSGDEDSKQSSSKIKIKAEIGIAGLFKAGVEWIKEKTNPDTIIKAIKKKENTESGYSAQIGSSGDYAQIGSSGNYAKIGSSGYSAQIGSSGDSAKIGSSGNYAKIGSSGDSAKIGSSGDSAQIGSSGNYAQIGSSGNSAQIGSSGNSAKIDSTGEDSIIMCAGTGSRAKAKLGSWITLAEWKWNDEKNRNVPICVKTEYVDENNIKADTWYQLKNGEFVEVTE